MDQVIYPCNSMDNTMDQVTYLLTSQQPDAACLPTQAVSIPTAVAKAGQRY